MKFTTENGEAGKLPILRPSSFKMLEAQGCGMWLRCDFLDSWLHDIMATVSESNDSSNSKNDNAWKNNEDGKDKKTRRIAIAEASCWTVTFVFLPSKVLPPNHDVMEKTLQLPYPLCKQQRKHSEVQMLRKTTQNWQQTLYPKVLQILAT